MADPKLRAQVEAGRQVAYHLLKGLKIIGMYRHNESKYGEYLEKAHASLSTYTKEYGALNLMGQYSYVWRNPWYVASGAPKDARTNMVYINLRYTLP